MVGRFVPQVGGFGGPCFLGTFPHPAPRSMWLDMNDGPPAHFGIGFDVLDHLVEPRQRVIQHSKPPASGGLMYAWASHNKGDFGPMVRLLADQVADLLPHPQSSNSSSADT